VKIPPEQLSPFEGGRFYRYSDLKDLGFAESWNTIKSWQARFGFPLGTLVGHTRVWTGAELNAWFASRPSARLSQNREVA
jgi:hypothetical protein